MVRGSDEMDVNVLTRFTAQSLSIHFSNLLRASDTWQRQKKKEWKKKQKQMETGVLAIGNPMRSDARVHRNKMIVRFECLATKKKKRRKSDEK